MVEANVSGGRITLALDTDLNDLFSYLWFEKAIKPRLIGEAYLIRYIDDFIVCFQYRRDAIRFQEALERRLCKFKLQLEPSKSRLIEFGRFASRHAKEKKRTIISVA